MAVIGIGFGSSEMSHGWSAAYEPALKDPFSLPTQEIWRLEFGSQHHELKGVEGLNIYPRKPAVGALMNTYL